MSHIATKWAFDQPRAFPDMKPSELCVLLVLADCHNPAQGCFPSQAFIQEATNLSERSVRDQLDRLRDRGLVNWAEARKGGHRDNNRYMLGFEAGYQPAEFAGSSNRQETTDQPANSDEPAGKVLPVDKGTVKGTVTEPLRESAREGERGSGETGAGHPVDGRHERTPEASGGPDGAHLPHAELLERLRLKAATTITDDRDEVDREWRKLSPDDRRQAEARYEIWLGEVRKLGRRAIPGLAKYLRDGLWRPIAVALAGSAASLAATFAPPWSRRWWWLYHDFVRRCPKPFAAGAQQILRDKLGLAKNRVGWKLPDGLSGETLEERSAADLRQVPSDSAEARAFADAFRALGAAFEMPDAVDWIFVPRAPPDEWLAGWRGEQEARSGAAGEATGKQTTGQAA